STGDLRCSIHSSHPGPPKGWHPCNHGKPDSKSRPAPRRMHHPNEETLTFPIKRPGEICSCTHFHFPTGSEKKSGGKTLFCPGHLFPGFVIPYPPGWRPAHS